ncbi:hypothetical protein [uncultured Nostoc sp.]|uniref:hypothetical protein n=1 Tax=uncultured Nostoc sp. TaxID=340711 RepID=UPI0035CB3EBE
MDAAVGLDDFIKVARISRTATKQLPTEEELLDLEFDSLTNDIKSGESLTITVSVQKSQKPLSPCSLPPAPCGFNDKSLAGHDMTSGNG